MNLINKLVLTSSAILLSTSVFAGGSPKPVDSVVHLSPYLYQDFNGDRFDGSIGADLTLLKDDQLHHGNVHTPIAFLSGEIEGKIQFNDYDSNGVGDTSLDTSKGPNVKTADLDVHFIANNWVSGYLSSDWSTYNAPEAEQAFVTLGNLNESSVYASIGKQYQPFGKFTTSRVENTVGKASFRTKEDGMSIGFYQDGLNVVAFTYRPLTADVNDHQGDAVFKEGGARVGYNFAAGDMTFDVIGSYETNTPEYSSTFYKTGAMDIYGKVAMGRTAGKLNSNFSQWNGSDYTPSTTYVEANYNFDVFGHTMTAGANYESNSKTKAVNIDKSAWGVTLATSWWSNTTQKISYLRTKQFANSDSVTGTTSTSAHSLSEEAASYGSSENHFNFVFGANF